MKRILGTVAALGVLGYSALAGAAQITFTLGTNATVNSVSSFAGDPTLPPGSTGVDPLLGPYFIGPSTSGSLTIDITGNAVTLVGGTLQFDLVTPLGSLGNIESHVVATASGGVGTLSGDSILWDMSGAPGTGTFWNATGTWTCHGVNLCNAFGLPADPTTLPIGTLGLFVGTTSVAPTLLGIWNLDPTHTSILGTTRNTIAINSPDSGNPGQIAQWYSFGGSDLGHLPEPGSFALVLLGLGGLALRGRKA